MRTTEADEESKAAPVHRPPHKDNEDANLTSITALSSNKSMQNKRLHHKELKDGIVGLKNNSLYCYMNACLQCLLPIDELRDHYINNEFKRFHDTRTISNSNDYSRKVAEFFRDAFEYDAKKEVVLNPTGLKNLIRKRFYPTMQHDSHEFFMHVLS